MLRFASIQPLTNCPKVLRHQTGSAWLYPDYRWWFWDPTARTTSSRALSLEWQHQAHPCWSLASPLHSQQLCPASWCLWGQLAFQGGRLTWSGEIETTVGPAQRTPMGWQRKHVASGNQRGPGGTLLGLCQEMHSDLLALSKAKKEKGYDWVAKSVMLCLSVCMEPQWLQG